MTLCSERHEERVKQKRKRHREIGKRERERETVKESKGRYFRRLWLTLPVLLGFESKEEA